MNEDYLQYIWRYQRLPHGRLFCTSGRELTVLFQGHWNRNSGPDFLEAKLRIGRELWVGSVEVHVKSSEWRRHKHQHDPSYANVILHVVLEDDEPLVNAKAQEVPTLVLEPLIDKKHWFDYQAFIQTPQNLPCAVRLHEVEGIAREGWLHRMAVERIAEKTKRVGVLMQSHQNDWNAVWWNMLCRAFGFGLNHTAYELLAQSLPWQVVGKFADRPQRLEALLAVHSGWWMVDLRLSSIGELAAEYTHYQKMFGLKPVHPSAWQRGRMKPANHPRVRLGQLAAVIFGGALQWRAISSAESLDALIHQLSQSMKVVALNLPAQLGATEPLGRGTLESIIGNAVIPMLFFNYRLQNDDQGVAKVLGWMEEMLREDNKITRLWLDHGWRADNLLESQGQLHLYKEYCCQKKCLSCSIGVTLLNNLSYDTADT